MWWMLGVARLVVLSVACRRGPTDLALFFEAFPSFRAPFARPFAQFTLSAVRDAGALAAGQDCWPVLPYHLSFLCSPPFLCLFVLDGFFLFCFDDCADRVRSELRGRAVGFWANKRRKLLSLICFENNSKSFPAPAPATPPA